MNDSKKPKRPAIIQVEKTGLSPFTGSIVPLMPTDVITPGIFQQPF
jgi:hypothetical protein